MSNSAASAYARVATTTASPRDIEAQTLLKAANKLQDAVNNADPLSEQTMQALMFNRKLWTIFLSAAMSDNKPQTIDVRQKIANISVFVLSQNAALQKCPQFAHFRPLL